MQPSTFDVHQLKPKTYHQNMQSLYFKINNLINQFLTSLTEVIRRFGFQSNANHYHGFLMKTFIPLELQSYVNFCCEDPAFKSLAICSMEPFASARKIKDKQLLKKTNNLQLDRIPASYNNIAQNQRKQGQKFKQRLNNGISGANKPILDIQVEMRLREWIFNEKRKKNKVRPIDITRRAMMITGINNYQAISAWCKRFLFKYPQIKQLIHKQNNQLKKKVQDYNQQSNRIQEEKLTEKNITDDKNQEIKKSQAYQQQIYQNEQKTCRKPDIVAKLLSDSYKGNQHIQRDDLLNEPEKGLKTKKKEDELQLKQAYLRLQQKVKNKLYGYSQ